MPSVVRTRVITVQRSSFGSCFRGSAPKRGDKRPLDRTDRQRPWSLDFFVGQTSAPLVRSRARIAIVPPAKIPNPATGSILRRIVGRGDHSVEFLVHIEVHWPADGDPKELERLTTAERV